jgi:hypothetical protein
MRRLLSGFVLATTLSVLASAQTSSVTFDPATRVFRLDGGNSFTGAAGWRRPMRSHRRFL